MSNSCYNPFIYAIYNVSWSMISRLVGIYVPLTYLRT